MTCPPTPTMYSWPAWRQHGPWLRRSVPQHVGSMADWSAGVVKEGGQFHRIPLGPGRPESRPNWSKLLHKVLSRIERAAAAEASWCTGHTR